MMVKTNVSTTTVGGTNAKSTEFKESTLTAQPLGNNESEGANARDTVPEQQQKRAERLL